MDDQTIIFRYLHPADQPKAKTLILAGLEGHWGWIDPTLNPDLTDLCSAYSGCTCLVAERAGELIGTGILVPRGAGTAEIVRMSVAISARRHGIGRQILERLIQSARQQGIHRIVLETTATWQDAVAFYLANGFHPTHLQDGDQYFELLI